MEAVVSTEFAAEYVMMAKLQGATINVSIEIPWTNEEELFMNSILLDGNGVKDLTLWLRPPCKSIACLETRFRFVCC